MPATAKEALIVALDVPTVDEALASVEALGDSVSFFKVGLQLFITGELPRLLQALRHKDIFVDLKVPGDISNTIASVIDFCVKTQVRFLTLSESMPPAAIAAARSARDKHGSKVPQLLTVPFLSSLDRSDLIAMTGSDDVNAIVQQRAGRALQAGCDGIIASGDVIGLCRKTFPEAVIVSPGIRPLGTNPDDQKRFTTPGEAILLGSDYLVVGRPILKNDSPARMAKEIIAEIDKAMTQRDRASADSPYSAAAPARA